ncbi:30S ribosomal protein S4, partial [Candidatus Woesearchaeota archaeon]|nr:30S ribosomal protein S4 [Candidatus Woesearchaeota archaeon]
LKEYGLKNKKEIWKMRSVLRSFSSQAKSLVALETAQAEKEKQQLLTRLRACGLLTPESTLDDILGLSLRDILERRLQTLVFKKGLARSFNQARQFITHQHIMIGDKKIASPSYIVRVNEENNIFFVANSSLSDPEHPERSVKEKVEQEKEKVKEEKPAEEAKTPEKKPAAEEVKGEEEKLTPEEESQEEVLEEMGIVEEEEDKL